MAEIKCKFCGELFIPKRKWQEFCIPEHRHQYWLDHNPRVKDITNNKRLDPKEHAKLNKALNKINYILSSYIMTDSDTIILNIIKFKL